MTVGALTLAELGVHLQDNGLPNEVRGDSDPLIRGCNTIDGATEGEITFLANPKYRQQVAKSHASAIIMRDDPNLAINIPQIVCDDPYQALTMAVIRIHGFRTHPGWGIDAAAQIDPTATLGPDASIAPGVSIGAGAVLGSAVTLYPGVYVGPNVVLGDDVVLYPNVVVYDGCQLGDRVVIHAGTVIGEDGLGYAPVGEQWMKIPQAGNVILEHDVEIGANCTIDRATLGITLIGAGTKFSNLIAIGHGCQIGPDCMFVAQVGLAGSVKVGKHVTMAGQVGVAGHLTIGDNAQVFAKAGVASSVKPGTSVLGAPAAPLADVRRQFAAVQRLPRLRERVKSMERELAALRDAVARLTAKEDDTATGRGEGRVQ